MSLSLQVQLGAIDKLTPKLSDVLKNTKSTFASIAKISQNVDYLKSFNVQIGRFDTVSKKIDSLGKHSEIVTNHISELNKKLKETTSVTGKKNIEVQISDAQEKLQKITNSSKMATESFDKLKNTLKAAGIDSEKFAETQNKITNAITRQQPALKQLINLEEQRKKLSSDYQKNMSVISGISNAGSSLRSTGRMLAEPLLNAGRKSVDFEKQTSRVEAFSLGDIGDRATRKEGMKEFVAKAKELGAITMYSNAEIMQAFQEQGKAGFSKTDMLKSIKSMVDIASAGDVSLAESVSVSSEAMKGFKMQVSDISNIGDIIAYVSNKSAANFLDMGEAYKYAAIVAQKCGSDIYDVSAMIGMLSDAGIKGTQAGTALRAMFARLANPTNEALEVLTKYKIKLDEAGKFRKMPDIFSDIAKGMGKKGSKEAVEDIAKMFGLEAMPAAAELIYNSFRKVTEGGGNTKKAFSELEKNIASIHQNSKGYSVRIAGIMNDNSAAAIKSFNGSVENLADTFNNKLIPSMTSVLNNSLIPVVNNIASWADKNPLLATQLAWVAAGVSGLAVVAGTLMTAIAGVVGTVITLKFGFGGTILKVEELILKFKNLVTASLAARAAAAAVGTAAVGSTVVAGSAGAAGTAAAVAGAGFFAKFASRLSGVGSAVATKLPVLGKAASGLKNFGAFKALGLAGSALELGQNAYQGADTGNYREAFFGGSEAGLGSNALKYAGIGSTLGWVVPIVGPLIGAGVGATFGVIGKLIASTYETQAKKEIPPKNVIEIQQKQMEAANISKKGDNYNQTFSPIFNITTSTNMNEKQVADLVYQKMVEMYDEQQRRQRAKFHD